MCVVHEAPNTDLKWEKLIQDRLYSWSHKVTVRTFSDDISTAAGSFGFNKTMILFISKIYIITPNSRCPSEGVIRERDIS